MNNENVSLFSFCNSEYFDVLHYNNEHDECRKITDFQKLHKIGEGAYGTVYKARDKKNNEIVALKKVRVENHKEGFPLNTLREINILTRLNHNNIIHLKEVCTGKTFSSIYLVMDYGYLDVISILESRKKMIPEPQVKCMMLQLLNGLQYVHKNHIIHRDLKVSNLLLTDSGCLKIADFGLAKLWDQDDTYMTPNVVTLWYRAPEILLQAKTQNFAIDMWSTGCVMGELLLCKPLFKGRSEIHQISQIIDLLGTPNDTIWPEFSELPVLENFILRDQPHNNLKNTFYQLSDAGINLVNSLLTYDPLKRITAEESLKSYYFKEDPIPCAPEELPDFFLQNSSLKKKLEDTDDYRETKMMKPF